MRKSIIALAAVAFIGLTSCENAADQINEEGTSNGSEMSASENGETQMDASMVSQTGTPVFKFEKENHDFGVIQEGEVAKYDFVFTNTGDAPLIISSASGSCGCTVPEWPTEPIAPGAKGTIHVEFDSKGRPGAANKQVNIQANTVPSTKQLAISAQVTPKAVEEVEANG